MSRLATSISKQSLLAALLFLCGGCNLGFTDDATSTAQSNSCLQNNECEGGYCSGGICQTKNTSIGALLLQVTPAAGTPLIAGVPFTKVLTGPDDFERGPGGIEINLEHASRLTGLVKGAQIQTENCVIDPEYSAGESKPDQSLAARLTLTPRTRLLGIASPARTVEAADAGDGSYPIELSVPAGSYDIYIEPRPGDGGCVRPPYLVLNQDIASGDVDLGVNLPEPTSLNVRVHYMGGATDLRNWTVDIVERDSGRRLSNRAVLGEGEEKDGVWKYSTRLAFSEVAGIENSPASELVRLSPPPDVVGPQVYVERSVVELFQDGDGLIDQLTEIPVSVSFRARVATSDATVPVPATVHFLATSLQSTGSGTVAAFSSSAETDENGVFEVKLLPGTYRMLTRPWDESLGPVESQITVSDAEVQAGRTIPVQPRKLVSAQLLDFHDNPIGGISMVMTASAVDRNPSVLEIAQGLRVFPPGATSDSTDSHGRFKILADSGVFDLSSRSLESSGYPWSVHLGARVSNDGLELGRLRIPLPVAVSGTLNSQDIGAVVPEALIVAYAMVKNGKPVADPNDADQATPVAESRADSEGRFRLLLPSTLE
jgi:hypothetical protein